MKCIVCKRPKEELDKENIRLSEQKVESSWERVWICDTCLNDLQE